MDKRKTTAIIYALLAAVFYAINVPISKILLKNVGPTTMAALLYLGAGIGIGILSMFNKKDRKNSERLSRKDLPFVIGMIVLDIAAPIFLMLGISYGSSANASLLGNFEIVVLKGIFSGLGALVIALIKRETMPEIRYIGAALILGFVAYGLSIFLYIRSQNVLGAAKTSAYYAAAPFVGAFLSFVVFREQLSWMYFIALIVMVGGSALVVADTLIRHHAHEHQHSFTHTHDGTTHTHTVTHSHDHNHYVTDDRHGHHHTSKELEKLPGAMHI